MSKLQLKDWAALAEVVAALAMVASLLYVGAGVRQNTRAIEGATYQEVVRASNEYLLALASNGELAEISVRARADPSQLTDSEGLRHFYYERVFWRNMENAFLQHERGILGPDEWEVYLRIACRLRNDHTWEFHVGALSPGFVEVVESCPD